MGNKRYKYLIVGGGHAAAYAIRGIREVDADGSIGLVGEESELPYKRPPLSKKLWQGKPLSSVWSGMGLEDKSVETHLGRRAVVLNPSLKQVVDDEGNSYMFDKLLIATGGTPRRLPFGDGNVIYY